MPSHPNRSRSTPKPGRAPTPAQVRAARARFDMTQDAAARLVYASPRAWQKWETDKGMEDHRPMHAGLFELFAAKAALQANPGRADAFVEGGALKVDP